MGLGKEGIHVATLAIIAAYIIYQIATGGHKTNNAGGLESFLTPTCIQMQEQAECGYLLR